MIAAILALQASQMDSPPPAAEVQSAVERDWVRGPALPARSWLTTRSREAASRYWRCRKSNVGGTFISEPGVDLRGDIWWMIYDQKVQCRALRARLLTTFDRDLRAWLARTPNSGVSPGDSDRVLDLFERAIDQQIFSGFAL